MKLQMIDYHCHILPGLDDGPRDIADSVAMAAQLADHGFTEVYCTPHQIRGYYVAEAAQVLAAVAELQARLDLEGIGIRLHPGREYYVDEFFSSVLADQLTLGRSALVLFEAPVQTGAELLKDAVYQTIRQQLVPLLAHPERYQILTVPSPGWFSRRRQDDTALAENLLEMGCFFQGNVGSFAGLYGKEAMRTSITFLERGFYACLGSDGHSPGHLNRVLNKGLRKIREIVGDAALEKLFQEGWRR